MRKKFLLIIVLFCLCVAPVELLHAGEIETKTNESVMISYSAHVQRVGWTESKYNGERIGTTGAGLRMEALKINVSNIREFTGEVAYRSHVQTYGWESTWRKNGQISGTEGQSKRLEAVQIKLTGQLGKYYDVYYRVHAETFGWLDWAKNGESAGTTGYSKRIEAIEIVLSEKGTAMSKAQEYPCISSDNGVSYSTHIQTYGWEQKAKTNGQMSGTQGEAKRLEGIKIRLQNSPYSGNIEYLSHVQTYGWEDKWKTNGQMSGTQGKSKRLEAIRIRLTGELAEKCDVFYRVHSQHFGWLGWVKNGEMAGTAGFSYRMESIQILLLPKGARTFPDTSGFIDKNDMVSAPQWNVSAIAAVSEGSGYLINEPIRLSSQPIGVFADSVQCHYAWKNNSTGEEGVIGDTALGNTISWMPTISGNYTIVMTAKDKKLREVVKKTDLEVKHGVIHREDAFFTAHKGLSSMAPDNSIPAFTMAGEHGFDSIEADVNETKDGVFVMSHDANLRDVCGIDVNISQISYEELQNYDTYHIIKGANAARYSNYELRIPTLEEYLDICEEYGCIPQIDIKNLNSFESISKVYDMLVERGIQEETIITSFNNLYLQLLRELDQNIKLTYGVDSTQYLDLEWFTDYNVGMSINYSKFLSGMDDSYLDKNIDINVYTVGDKKNAGIMLERGIKSITTNCILWE